MQKKVAVFINFGHLFCIVEHQIANKFHFEVAPLAGELGDAETSQQLHDIALRMYSCRTSGPFGIGPHGKPVVAWDEKFSCSKLCPDEARHEAQRLFDHYAQTLADSMPNLLRPFFCARIIRA